MIYNLTLSGNISLGGIHLSGNIDYTVPSAPAQEKSVTPTKQEQIVLPDLGYVLSKVEVAAIPDQYIDPTGTVQVTQNGTVNVREYQTAEVAVPNTYTAGDEGKVVQSGALVAQTDITVTENGVVNTTTVKQVTVDCPVPVVPVEEKDVNFYDYDGTVLYSYTAQEFAQLTEMPPNPDRTSEGLTAQGWNWSLADAKSYVADYGMADIGQMYVTTDGKTKILLRLISPRLSPRINFAINGTVTLEYGDGQTEVVTGTSVNTTLYRVHNYATEGDYWLAFDVAEGSELRFNTSVVNFDGAYDSAGSRAYTNSVIKAHIGRRLTNLSSAFRSCNSMVSVSLPTGMNTIYTLAFGDCTSLQYITVPSATLQLQNCFGIGGLKRVSLPNSLTKMLGTTFYSSFALERIAFPPGITALGSNECAGCPSLSLIVLPKELTSIPNGCFNQTYSLVKIIVPSKVTSIGTQAFRRMYGLGELKFEPTTPPTVANANAFEGLPPDCKILVPTGKLNAYKTAQYYPDPTVYTYEEY